MAFNVNKLAEMAKPRSEDAKKRAIDRKENREWLRMSQDIALCLHYYLRNAGMSQKELAEKMGVSAVYVNKLLKGGENLTLETICKIQKAIGEELISVAKPYITKNIVTFTLPQKFSSSAVNSDKYRGKQMKQNEYVQAVNNAA